MYILSSALFWIHLVGFLYTGDNFCDFQLLPCAPRPFYKGFYAEKKEFVPTDRKFFPNRIKHYSEEVNYFEKISSRESVSLLLKIAAIFVMFMSRPYNIVYTSM